MDLLVWTHTYSIDVEIVDNQHKKLVSILNELHNAHGNDEQITKILGELVDYTLYHFKTEEDLFQKYNYPDYAHHKAVHDKLVKDVQNYLSLFNTQDQTVKEKLMIFLSDWLKDHILGDDKKFGIFLKKANEEEDEDL